MTKKHLPTVEQIEQVEHILDEVEGFWQGATKMSRVYSGKNGAVAFVHPKNLANFLAENPNAKPLQLPPLDRRMLELVKMIFQEIEDAKSGRLDEATTFLVDIRNTEKPSKERLEKAPQLIGRGDLAAYIVDDGLCVVRDEDVEDFEREHPEAERITSPEQVEEFSERLQKKLRVA